MDGQDKQYNVLEYSLTIGLVAMEGRGFEYPTDLVAARDGRLYVPNRARDLGERGVRVTVTDIDSEYYGTFAHHGQGDGLYDLAYVHCGRHPRTPLRYRRLH